jgi:8-oxo-dGTP pyrophosphatase MutT (NUDIX family)
LTETAALTINQVQSALAAPHDAIAEFFPEGWFTAPPKSAAVLIPFLETPHGLEILYIRRTHVEGDMHSGQVAFPGGVSEVDDVNPEMTALREAEEEIGVNPHHVSILGSLGTLKTISNFLITPVVARLDWPVELNPSPGEVNRIFTIPISWLADPKNRRYELRSLPDPYPQLQVIYFNPYDGETLWGATARITVHLLEVLGLAEKK